MATTKKFILFAPMSEAAISAASNNANHMTDEVWREAEALARDRAKVNRMPLLLIQENDILSALKYCLPPGTTIIE